MRIILTIKAKFWFGYLAVFIMLLVLISVVCSDLILGEVSLSLIIL